MIISEELSDAYDAACVILTRGKHEGTTYRSPDGRVWAESDGETWEVDQSDLEAEAHSRAS